MSKTLILNIQFDGTDYHGWQVQPNAVTVQETLEKSVNKIMQQKIKLIASGRTDSGVHAREQYVSGIIEDFKIPHEKIKPAINRILPRDIRVNKAIITEKPFDARKDAIARDYTYHITNDPSVFKRRYAHYSKYKFDIEKMNEAAALFVGKHDFTTFSKVNAELDHYKSIVYECKWYQEGENDYYLNIKAIRFVYAMVRSLVGSMIDVGHNQRTVEDLIDALEAKDRNRCSKLAPPNGLFFNKVYYEKGSPV